MIATDVHFMKDMIIENELYELRWKLLFPSYNFFSTGENVVNNSLIPWKMLEGLTFFGFTSPVI